MKLFTKNIISPLWMYRLVRWVFGAFFIAIGMLYKDAWAAYLFGGLFIITSFFKPTGCIGANCSVETKG